ncbi:MAG: hypothetical protein B7X33_05870 [Lysobacterales bacterium 13-68-4]|nr:MAG: hypothetical protein B7X45_09285 [Xanthomonadales bacterium 15-68-25]OZB61899.1 MAG: hypothetical protein B7X33_05870 [Xanthomonadales bacterium 13-68-4]OZB66388.1 MAG: hypothetical protein B7X39_09655 [Xanthomonadales bacterium 14-68-21]
MTAPSLGAPEDAGSAGAHCPPPKDWRRSIGCLPIPLLFLAGFGLGWLIGGATGALWGAGIGLVLGLLAMGWLVRAIRGRR